MSKVSIIIPVYNAAPYLERCLDSAINQTLKDIEIICVNDCSKDNSLEILNLYSSQDSRIKVLNHEVNKGEGATRNTGLEIASGEYIAFLDADDALSLNFCENLYNKTLETKPDLVLGTALRIQGEKQNKIEENEIVFEHNNILFFTSYFCTAIYKRETIIENNIKYTPNLPLSTDLLFVNEYLMHAKTFEYEKDAYYIYYRREDSMNGLVLSDEKIDSGLFVFNKMIENFNSSPEILKNKEGYEYYCKYMFFNYLNVIFKNNNPNKRMHGAKRLTDTLKEIKFKDTLLVELQKKYPLFANFILNSKNSKAVDLFKLTKNEFMAANLRYKLSQNTNKNTILVTGGAGFIGSKIVNKLLQEGKRVVVIDNLSSGCKSSLIENQNLAFYELDLKNDDIEFVFKKEKPAFCIHLAAQTSVLKSVQDPLEDAEMNITTSIKLLSLCKKYNISKFVTASSAAVYGTPEYLPIDEAHPTIPISPYGLSKLTMEKYIEQIQIPYVIFRFSNVYGPRGNKTDNMGVISLFDNAMKNNEDIYIYGNGEQLRDFIFIDDIANIVTLALDSPVKNEIFNFSVNNGISIRELAEKMGKIYNYTKKPIHLNEREEEIKESILDNSKIMKFFPNLKFCELTDGLEKLKNSTTEPTIPIFITADNNYAPYVATTMVSVLINTKSFIEFYVLDSGISDENQEKIKSLNNKYKNFSVEFIKIDAEKYYKNLDCKDSSNRIPLATYNSALIPVIKPKLEKVLYLDPDIIVMDDIKKMYNFDIKDYAVGALWEEFAEKTYNIHRKENLKLHPNHKYFNAGAFIINVQKWIKDDITNKIFDAWRKNTDVLEAANQDVMNIVLNDTNYMPIPSQFNWLNQNYDYYKKCNEKIIVRHYNGKIKPWEISPNLEENKQLIFTIDKNKFWEIAKLTPFYDKLIQEAKIKNLTKYRVYSLLQKHHNT